MCMKIAIFPSFIVIIIPFLIDQGTNQTFVFTTIHGEPRLFRPTGKLNLYKCSQRYLVNLDFSDQCMNEYLENMLNCFTSQQLFAVISVKISFNLDSP